MLRPVLPLFLVFCALCSSLKVKGQNDSLYADSSRYRLWSPSFNSTDDDFCPVFYKNGVVFTSNRPNDFGVVYYDEKSNKRLLNIYYAEQTDSFAFSAPLLFSRKINSPFHDGPACFTQDDNTIVFTSSGRKKQRERLSLYRSLYEGGEWSDAKPVKFKGFVGSLAHAAFSPDGKTMYVVSDLSSGLGGTDIYVSTLGDNGWTAPVNMGPEINTKGSEKFPYVDEKGILYFASDGYPGLGKLDIFSAVKKNGHYVIKNMGYPINSTEDDFGFCCDSLFTRGFFSSDRGGLDANIFGFYRGALSPITYCKCDTVKKETYCFTFFEESTRTDKNTDGFAYEWDFGDGFKAQAIESDHCYSEPGDYTVQLNVIDSKTGVLFYNQATYDFPVESKNKLFINCPDTLQINTVTSVDAYGTTLPGYTIKKYSWDFGEKVFRKIGLKTNLSFPSTGRKRLKLDVFAEDNTTKKLTQFCAIKFIYVQVDPVKGPDKK